MAVQKTGNGSLVERVVQWARDVGGKIKTAVAEYTGSSSYAKADAPAAKPNNASASTARAAAKFAEVASLSIKNLDSPAPAKVGTWQTMYPVHGRYMKSIEFHKMKSPNEMKLNGDLMREILEEARTDPRLKAHFADIDKALEQLPKK